MRPSSGSFVALVVLVAKILVCFHMGSSGLDAAEIELRLQARDPENGAVRITPTRIDPWTLGVVVVDI